MKLEKMQKVALGTWFKFDKQCSDMLAEIKKHLKYTDDELRYVDSLSLFYNPSDGFIVIDENGNNFSVDSIISCLESDKDFDVFELSNCAI